MSLVFNAPAYVAIPWASHHRDVVEHDAIRYIQRAQKTRIPALELRSRLRAIKSGVVPVFGRIGQVGHDGPAQPVQPVSIIIDGYRPVTNVGAAVGFSRLDQGGDSAFGRLELLCSAEVSQGVLHGSCCGAAMEERVAGGVESPAGGDDSEVQP